MKMGKKITKTPQKINNHSAALNKADAGTAQAKPGAEKTKKSRRAPKIILICVLLVLAAAGFAFGFVYKSSHTAPAVEQTGTMYTGTSTGNKDAVETGPNVMGADGYVRKDRFYNFLLLGRDQISGSTDVFIIASFDVKNSKLSLMQIPRDTYVEYGGDGYYCKINSLYARLSNAARREGAEDVEKKAGHDLMELLQTNLNVKLDYYAIVDLEGFKSIVDRIGGVTLNVPANMTYYDEDQGLSINLRAGVQTLNGEQAEGFVRFRYGYTQGDLGRVEAQKIFMSAFFKQFKEKVSLSNIPGLISDILQYVNTDMPLSDCVYFANQAMKIDFANVSMMSAQGKSTNYGGSYFIIYREAMLMMLNKYFNVYTTDIPDQYFDVDRVFTLDRVDQINSIYTTPIETIDDGIFNAKDINENGIEISRSY